MTDRESVLVEAIRRLLATGLNGGNNVRMAFMAASRDALGDEDLAGAERSEAAVVFAREVLARVEGGTE